MQKKKANSDLLYFGFFTFISIVLISMIFWIFHSNGRSLIWTQDGLEEYVPKTIYLSEWLLELLHGNLKLFDLSLGMGNDAITYNSIWFYDPFNLIFLLAGREYYENLFSIAMFLRFYITGCSAYMLLRHYKYHDMPVVAGALTYEFCSFTLAKVMNHPNFCLPMIFFPLMILTMERLLEKKGWKGYVFSVALMALTSLYFFYMCVIFLIIYYIVRYRHLLRRAPLDISNNTPSIEKTHGHKGIWDFIINAFVIAGYSLLAGAMAGFLLVPNALTILTASRAGKMMLQTPSWWIFRLLRYPSIFIHSIMPPGWSGEYDLQLGFTALAFLAVLLYLCRKKDNTGKILLVILALISCVPFLNYILAAFSYVSGRWSFSIALLIAYIVCVVYKDFTKLTYPELLFMTVVVAIYDVIALRTHLESGYFLAVSLLTISLFVLWSIKLFFSQKSLWKSRVLAVLMIGTLVGNLCFYLPQVYNFTEEYAENGTIIESISQEPITAVYDQMEFPEFCRIGRLTTNSISASLVSNYSGMIGYDNTATVYTNLFYEEMGLPHNSINIQSGLNQRSILETLSGVKYYVLEKEENTNFDAICARIPFGYSLFQNMQNGEKTYAVYQNDYSLPLGIVLDQCASDTDLESWNPVEKQDLMQTTVILNSNKPAGQKDSSNIRQIFSENESISPMLLSEEDTEAFKDICHSTIEVDQIEYSGCSYDSDSQKLLVNQNNAQITFDFDPVPDCEYYLYLEGLDITPYNPNYKVGFRGTSEIRSSTFSIRSDSAPRATRQHDYLLNLGYSETGFSSCTLTIGAKGVFDLNDIRVLRQPMEKYRENMTFLSEHGIKNITIEGTSVKGTVQANGNKILFLSIPYSKGWSACVDGMQADVLRANYGFMAVPLSDGEHEIELHYMTPGLSIGTSLSVLGWICFFFLILRSSRKNRTSALKA